MLGVYMCITHLLTIWWRWGICISVHVPYSSDLFYTCLTAGVVQGYTATGTLDLTCWWWLVVCVIMVFLECRWYWIFHFPYNMASSYIHTFYIYDIFMFNIRSLLVYISYSMFIFTFHIFMHCTHFHITYLLQRCWSWGAARAGRGGGPLRSCASGSPAQGPAISAGKRTSAPLWAAY